MKQNQKSSSLWPLILRKLIERGRIIFRNADGMYRCYTGKKLQLKHAFIQQRQVLKKISF